MIVSARVLLAFALTLCGAEAARSEGTPGDFDFYVLALSWSPSFCAIEGEERSSPQCGTDAGHGFVVHGLWPQYEDGYPEFCEGDSAPRVPARLADTMLDIMPDRRLVYAQWRKHGTCSGLSIEAYLDLTRAAFDRVTIPPTFATADRARRSSARLVESAFVNANPGLEPDGIAVSCDGRLLEEVRICLTNKLEFRACAEVDRSGCRQNDIGLPAAE